MKLVRILALVALAAARRVRIVGLLALVATAAFAQLPVNPIPDESPRNFRRDVNLNLAYIESHLGTGGSGGFTDPTINPGDTLARLTTGVLGRIPHPGAPNQYLCTTGTNTVGWCPTINNLSSLAVGDGTAAGFMHLFPPADNTHYFGFAAPATRATALELVGPAADPTSGAVLSFAAPASNKSTSSWVTPMKISATGAGQLPMLSADPATCSPGDIFRSSTTNSIRDCIGTNVWANLKEEIHKFGLCPGTTCNNGAEATTTVLDFVRKAGKITNAFVTIATAPSSSLTINCDTSVGATVFTTAPNLNGLSGVVDLTSSIRAQTFTDSSYIGTCSVTGTSGKDIELVLITR